MGKRRRLAMGSVGISELGGMKDQYGADESPEGSSVVIGEYNKYIITKTYLYVGSLNLRYLKD